MEFKKKHEVAFRLPLEVWIILKNVSDSLRVSTQIRHRIFGINTLRPRQNGRRFADDTFKRIFFNENVRISIKISLKFVPKGPINNIPALVQIMDWRRSGDKPLSEPMMVSLLTHICVTRPQWVKPCFKANNMVSRKLRHHKMCSLHAIYPYNGDDFMVKPISIVRVPFHWNPKVHKSSCTYIIFMNERFVFW